MAIRASAPSHVGNLASVWVGCVPGLAVCVLGPEPCSLSVRYGQRKPVCGACVPSGDRVWSWSEVGAWPEGLCQGSYLPREEFFLFLQIPSYGLSLPL